MLSGTIVHIMRNMQIEAAMPAERLTDIITCMRGAAIEPKFLRTIHSTLRSEAKMILVEGKKGSRPGIEIGPALIIYGPDGDYTDEVEKMFAP